MNRNKKRRHFGLIRLFIAVLFSTGLVNSIITSIAVYLLVHAGLLTYNAETAPAAGRLLIFSVVLNIPICMGIAALSSKYMLKPVRELIEGMNSLADGDFKTRVKVGKITRRYPAFEEITRSFNKMAQELESTEMLRSDFINNFSHEFKTPIVSIAGFAQLLQHGNLPADQQKEYLEIISDESKRLSAMATKESLAGKTYMSGNTALCNYELHQFLAEKLGVKPLLLQISDLDDDSVDFRKKILELCDPYVTRSANLAAIGCLYPILKPDFNIGAGNQIEIRKNKIATVRMMNAYNTLGFEVCGMVVNAFLAANQESEMMKSGMGSEMPQIMMRGGMGR